MSPHESKKDSKIVDEIILYLLKHKHCSMNISLQQTKTLFEFTITTAPCKKEILDELDHYINQKRELEVEEYGWELMGESDAQGELCMVGLLIDELKIDTSNKKETVLHFIRHYKK